LVFSPRPQRDGGKPSRADMQLALDAGPPPEAAGGRADERKLICAAVQKGSNSMSDTISRLAFRLRQGAALAVFLVSAAAAGGVHAENILNGETIRLIVVSDPVFKAMQQIHDEMEKMAGGKIELN